MGCVNTVRVAVLAMSLVVACSAVGAQSARADYDAGKRAWGAGKAVEALEQWGAAADAGDRRAMLALGRLYLHGLGAPQDYVLAHMWFNLAASRGEKDALKERDALVAKMTPAERAEAQKRAREWGPGGGQAGAPKAASASQPAAAPLPSAAGPPPRAIREAQELLAALGYNSGAADGRWGARSATAYAAFLRDAGLPAGDRLTPEGLRAMRDVSKRQRAGTATGSGTSAEPQPAPPRSRPDALHRAVLAGDIDGLKAALETGVEVNARDGRGWTALMHAANKGYKLMVGPLLNAKADLDVQAADGATALFMAAVQGHSEIIELLVKAGADMFMRGPKGKTAVDVARGRYGDAEVARKKDEGRAVVALLEGKTWAQVEEAERKRKEFDRLWPAGKKFRECSGCPEMVVIPGGSYMMGSPSGEEGRSKGEGPLHEVRIPRRFAVGKYEVTFAEWDACVAGGGCGGYRPDDRGWGRGARPVVNVSWEDAKSYVEWLTRKTGKRYRLLSESEWEYVARAGTTGPFHFGGTISTDLANYRGSFTYGSGREGVYREKTVSVGSFPANDFGLHDVHGNVWEWVEDCWHGDYRGAPADGSAWTTGGGCGTRVLRGGSWFNIPGDLRSAYRLGFTAGDRLYDDGFRIAQTLTP